MTIIINHTHVDQRKRAIFWCFGFHFSTIPRVLYPDKEPVYASQPAMARSSRLQARECGSERRSWQHGMHLGVLNEWSYIYICHYFIWKVFPQAAIYQMSFLYRYIGLYSNTYIYIYKQTVVYPNQRWLQGDHQVRFIVGQAEGWYHTACFGLSSTYWGQPRDAAALFSIPNVEYYHVNGNVAESGSRREG